MTLNTAQASVQALRLRIEALRYEAAQLETIADTLDAQLLGPVAPVGSVLTISECQILLGLPRKSVVKLLDTGQLQEVPSGTRRRLIARHSVDRWLAA